MTERSQLNGVALLVLTAFTGCGGDPAPGKAAAPATVSHPVTEAALTSITLSPEAVKRLGIETAVAAVETVSPTRRVAAEIIAPPGGAVTVTAPVAGLLQAIDATPPIPGSRVSRGQAMFTLYPIQPADRDLSLEASREMATAEAELTLATQRVERLDRLLADGAASARAVEEARAQQKVAEAAAAAARGRASELQKSPAGTGGGLVVRAPMTGTLQSVTAAPGQSVAASAPLFQVVQAEALWVRVPLFVGERASVNLTKPAVVVGLANDPAGTRLAASPVAGPPSADPNNATTDLYYALASSERTVRLGERVSVLLPLTGAQQALVVPSAAVVYDISGGAWVYEATNALTFVRRRIEIVSHTGNRTIVARGIDAGKKVVTAGAAELFGTEFGAGK